MDLIERAKAELARLSEDPDLVEPLLKVVRVFQEQGFDPLARGFAVEYLHLLLREKPLTVLTDDPAEWEPFSDRVGGDAVFWRSRRDPDAVSKNGGKTFWLRSDAQLCHPEPPPEFTSVPRDMVRMPETYRDALRLKESSPKEPDLVPSPGGVDGAGGKG
jgi:hypothetical protein